MMGDSRVSGWRVFISMVFGLALAIAPLPHWLQILRPDFLLILVIYWSLSAPRLAGMTFAWVCGFAVDVIQGIVLGQHALAFLFVAYWTHRWQLRMRIFPIWQQAMTVGFLLLVYQALIFWIDGIVGQALSSGLRWLPVITGALVWPFIVATLDTWNRVRR